MPVPRSFVDLGKTIQPAIIEEPEPVEKVKVKRVSKAVKKSLEPKTEPEPSVS